MASRPQAANVTRCTDPDDRGTSTARGLGRISRPSRLAPLLRKLHRPPSRPASACHAHSSQSARCFLGRWLAWPRPILRRLVVRHLERHVTKREREPREEASKRLPYVRVCARVCVCVVCVVCV